MGKPATQRRLHETEASAYVRALKTSPRKLNLVAQLIRGKPAAVALNELAFNKRRIAHDVRKVLQAAIANAENNHQLDVDRLYVKEATVGRAFSLRRVHARGRGHTAPIEKYFSNLLVVVRERGEEEQARDAAEATAPVKTEAKGEEKSEAKTKPAPKAKHDKAKAESKAKEKAKPKVKTKEKK
jgi:large subunit ribosomal protein L22